MTAIRTAICALFLASLLLLVAPSVHADLETPGDVPTRLTVRPVPSAVDIDINYGGAQVNIKGTAPRGAQVVVKISSPPASTVLSKKGRVLGFLWMTTERARVDNVPGLCALYSSAPLQSLLSSDELARLQIDPTFAALLNGATVESAAPDETPISPSDAQAYLQGLLNARIEQGFYRLHERDISIQGTEWATSLSLPADAPIGSYEVTAYAIEDMQVVGKDTASFSVEKSGVVDFLGTMARNNAVAYGGLTIVVAVAAGLGVGRLFSGEGGH